MSIGRYRCMIHADERMTLQELQDMYDRAIDSEPVWTESNLRAYEAHIAEVIRLIAEAVRR